MAENKTKNRRQALLVEYTAAQNSAQHHDSLVWTTTGMIWSAELVLIGFVIQSIDRPKFIIAIIAAYFLAITLLVYLWKTMNSFRQIRNQKYDRCKEIEKEFGLTQHTNLRFKKGVGKRFFNFVMCVFIFAWSTILVTFLFF